VVDNFLVFQLRKAAIELPDRHEVGWLLETDCLIRFAFQLIKGMWRGDGRRKYQLLGSLVAQGPQRGPHRRARSDTIVNNDDHAVFGGDVRSSRKIGGTPTYDLAQRLVPCLLQPRIIDTKDRNQSPVGHQNGIWTIRDSADGKFRLSRRANLADQDKPKRCPKATRDLESDRQSAPGQGENDRAVAPESQQFLGQGKTRLLPIREHGLDLRDGHVIRSPKEGNRKTPRTALIGVKSSGPTQRRSSPIDLTQWHASSTLLDSPTMTAEERDVSGGYDDDEPVELNIGVDTVSTIISMARLFDSEAELSEPDEEMGEEVPADLEEEAARRPTEGGAISEELREAIDDLNDDEVIDLIAITWVGRGDFGRDDWDEARATARERHRRHSADYLMGIPALGDYLEEGLSVLGHNYQEP